MQYILATYWPHITAVVALLGAAVNFLPGWLSKRATTPEGGWPEAFWPDDKPAPASFTQYVSTIEDKCAGLDAGDVVTVLRSGVSPKAAGVVREVKG